jgi:hypothetical protein
MDMQAWLTTFNQSNTRSNTVKNLLKGSIALGVALAALSTNSNAQTVQVNALGSSALFLELGLAASGSSIGASCVWSTATNGVVVASDGTVTPAATDTGSAFVAWTPSSAGCGTVDSTTQIYAYLQTDSVVGDRCLFNSCTIKNTGSGTTSAGLIKGTSNEVSLPAAIATALNGSLGTGLAVTAAGTDIRPEDAEFAMTRALTPCGTAVATGSQYLGLGYTNGGTIGSFFSGSTFNVVSFTLPTSYAVTPVGATPILVVANGFDASVTNLSSTTLAGFLDGHNSFTGQALASPSATGSAVTTLIREPLSGTYNTMEYNVPNTVALKTSQDVGVNQPTGQPNCNGTAVSSNPMNIAATSGSGARKRAIGTGQELSEVIANPVSLGYGFWSVANYKGFTSALAPNVRYLKIDGVDPLFSTTHTYTGAIPVTGSDDLLHVTLGNINTATSNYPIWSLLRLVNLGSGPTAGVTALANAAQAVVTFNSTTALPDFITQNALTVVRSHFLPPAGAGEPTVAADGHVGNITGSACTATEAGGDVGGVVSTLATDSLFCTNHRNNTGNTGQRR